MTYDPHLQPPGDPQHNYPPPAAYFPQPPPLAWQSPPAALAYSTPYASPRPTAVTVLAILGIIFAAFWILAALGSIFTLVFTATMMRKLTSGMPGYDGIIQVQALQGIAGGLLGTALLTVAIGCLRLSPWARRGMVIVAIVTLVYVAAKLIVTLVWTIPYQQQMMTTWVTSSSGLRTTSTTVRSSTFRGFSGAQSVMAFGMAILTSAYPIVVLVLMTRQRMKQVFDQAPA
jgi:hypothetical protein